MYIHSVIQPSLLSSSKTFSSLLATTNLLYVSIDKLILDILYKQNHPIYYPYVPLNCLIAFFKEEILNRNRNKNCWCSISSLMIIFKWQDFILTPNLPGHPLVSYPVTVKENIHARWDTHSLQLRKRGQGYCPQLFVALRDVTKDCQAEPRLELVSIVTVKLPARGREKWRHSLDVITGTAYYQASSDWCGW